MATTVYEKEEGTLLVDAAVPSPADIETAKQILKALGKVVASERGAATEAVLRELVESGSPEAVTRLLLVILEEFSRGHAVALTSSEQEVSTRQAAEYLGVSRPHVVKLVDAGLIPSRKVGAHRRILLEDVAAYRKNTDARHRILDDLANETQELGLYERKG